MLSRSQFALDKIAPKRGQLAVLLLTAIVLSGGLVPVHTMSGPVNNVSGFFVHVLDKHKAILAFVRPLAEGFVGKASVNEGCLASIHNFFGNIKIVSIPVNDISLIRGAGWIDGQSIVVCDGFCTDVFKLSFWEYRKPILIFLRHINASKLLAGNKPSCWFFSDISISDNDPPRLMQLWYGSERSGAGSEPRATTSDERCSRRSGRISGCFIGALENAQLTVKNERGYKDQKRAEVNSNNPRQFAAALCLFGFVLFACITAKLVSKTVKWGRYSVLTCYLGFMTFCIAGICLIYGFYNLFFSNFPAT